MDSLDDFHANARSKGLLVDSNLLVLLVVGLVNRDRISKFKRTAGYSGEDWDLLAAIIENTSLCYTLPYVLAEVSNLTDLWSGPRK